MNRLGITLILILLCGTCLLGCMDGHSVELNPSSPSLHKPGSAPGARSPQLWGLYEINIDIDSGIVDAIPMRSALFEANVVNFLNSDPENLSFELKGVNAAADFIDIDIDIGITHPFGGMEGYRGYDVRGVLIGNGSSNFKSDANLAFATPGIDTVMLGDPKGDGGGPDGYTRWFNPGEFHVPGLGGYTGGIYSTPGFTGMSIINPYKVFAYGLNASEDVFDHFQIDNYNNVFLAGTTNFRNYYIRFPRSDGVRFNYAVIASWNGAAEEFHPANAPEVVAADCVVTPKIYYVDNLDKGGDLVIDFSLAGHGEQPDLLIIESSVIRTVHAYLPDDIVTGCGDVYTSYHVEIPADNVTGIENQYFWLIGVYENFKYTGVRGIPNDASNDNLAAFFRYDLYVSPQTYDSDPVCNLSIITDLSNPITGNVQIDATASYDPLLEPLEYYWDFDGDGFFNEPFDDNYDGPANYPLHTYESDFSGEICLKLVAADRSSECCEVIDIDVFTPVSYDCDVIPGNYDPMYELTDDFEILPVDDDGCSLPLTIGFDFSYGDNIFRYAPVVYNGGLGFGFDCFDCCTATCQSTEMSDWIHVIGYDLNLPLGGEIRYGSKTIDNVDCFILEFIGVPAFYDSGANTFQVVLFDTPQNRYDDFLIQIKEAYPPSADTFYRVNDYTCCLAADKSDVPASWAVKGM